jgi:predicted aconitase with swiveling domain
MGRIEIKCKGILPGKATGPAMIFDQPISFQGEIDEEGTVVVKDHPYEGKSVAGCVLIYPEAKGSSGGCMMLRLLAQRGKQPAAIVNTKKLDPNLVEGAILADIPMLCFPETSPYGLIVSGDLVEINADAGLLTRL